MAGTDAAMLARMGDRARLAGRFAEAEASYRASLALAPDDRTALSLALALAAQGKAREAAGLLARLARAGGALPAEDRERAASALADARRELATVRVEATAGAAVDVDGLPAGLAPLAEPLFLDPGRHTVRAARPGHRPSEAEVPAEAGRTYIVKLGLVPVGNPSHATSGSPSRVTSGNPSPATSGSPSRATSGSPSRATSGSPSRANEPSTAALPPLFDLSSETFFVGTEGGARAAGLGASVAAFLGGLSALAIAEVNNGGVALATADIQLRGGGSCLGPDPHIAGPCADLAEAVDARGAAASAAGILLSGAGVLGVATLLSVLVLPPPRPAPRGGLAFSLSPVASPSGGGVSLEASW